MGRARWWIGLLWSLLLLHLAAPAIGLDLGVTWQVGQPPGITTEPATDITESSAVLNGALTDLGGLATVEVSFEWGTSPALGQETAPQPLGETGSFQAVLSDLEPDREYYYRAKGVGNGATVGDTLTFQTLAAAPVGDFFPYWLYILVLVIVASIVAYVLQRKYFPRGAKRELKERLASALTRLKEDSQSPDRWLEVAEAYLALGKLKMAQSYGERSLSLDAGHARARALVDDVKGRLAVGKAEAKEVEDVEASGLKEAREQLVQELRPSETIVCPFCSTFLGATAIKCFACGRNVDKVETLEERIDRAKARLERDEDDQDALLTMAAYLVLNERPEEALEMLNRLSLVDEHYPGVWWVKARVFKKLGKPKAADAAIKRALQLADEGDKG